MTEPSTGGSDVRYYCTAGNGMERFLIDEVKKKLAAQHVCQLPGKVLFSSSAGIDRVSELKAAERLFLLLKQDSPQWLSAHTSPAKAASLLQSRLLGDRNQWACALMTWSRLQGELTGRGRAVNPPSSALGMTRKTEAGKKNEEQKQKEERYIGASTKSARERREEEEEDRRLSNVEQSGMKTLEKKSKREKEQRGIEGVKAKESKGEEDKSEETHIEAQTQEKKRKRGDDDDGDEEEKCVKKEKTSDRQSRTEGEEERGVVMEFNSCRQNVKTPGGTDESVLQPVLLQPSSVPVSFRISCKCTGSLSRYFSTQEVSKVIGVGLSRLMGWKVELKNPQLEVNVCLSNDHCLLGIPLTRLPLANRSYIQTTGLRSTVAWAMASLAQIQPGFCVVDPMCGVGTILIEAAQEHKAAHFLGMDNDDGQLLKANQNVKFAELGSRMHLLKASSMALPLPSASVDAVVCDLPFGRKFGTKTSMAANLPLILAEIERVLRIDGYLVLLLSPQLSCLLKKLLSQKETSMTPYQETKPATRIQDCPATSPSSTKQQTPQIHQDVNSTPTEETDPPPHLSSLKHQATFRVSLGAIDGLIHKYVKIDT
ncbi:THUMP domain-containing protein 2 [Labrus mixtus]|uniref:THUMP domain-containing protein 2 n=1 Tax=Labrus mixtus TaxID=508554 RepID=UPI0029C01F52|nr:THUMP domain-containing protein 2 [Labrus mixtus]